MLEWQSTVFRETVQTHFLVSNSLIIRGQLLGMFWSKELVILYDLSLPAIGLAIY